MRANSEGSIYQRKDGRWVACVSLLKDGKRQRVPRYAKTEEEARRLLTELKHRQDTHEPIHFGRQSVAAWLETWLETFIRPRRKPRTWADYHKVIHTYVLPAFGKEPLQVAPEMIQAMLNHHVEMGHERTAALIRTILHGAFKRAVKLKRMAWNPIDALESVRVVPKETEVFTAEQAETFLRAVTGHRLEALFWVAVGLGLRKGEICGLSLGDVDLENATIQVRETLQRVKLPGEKKSRILEGSPKSRASKRMLPLPDCIVEALRRHMSRREQESLLAGTAWKESGRVFTTTIGTALDADKLTRVFHSLTTKPRFPGYAFTICGTPAEHSCMRKECRRSPSRRSSGTANWSPQGATRTPILRSRKRHWARSGTC